MPELSVSRIGWRRAGADNFSTGVEQLLRLSFDGIDEVLVCAIGAQSLDDFGGWVKIDSDALEMNSERGLAEITADRAPEQDIELRKGERMVG